MCRCVFCSLWTPCQGHNAAVAGLAFTQDAARLASLGASFCRQVVVWLVHNAFLQSKLTSNPNILLLLAMTCISAKLTCTRKKAGMFHFAPLRLCRSRYSSLDCTVRFWQTGTGGKMELLNREQIVVAKMGKGNEQRRTAEVCIDIQAISSSNRLK